MHITTEEGQLEILERDRESSSGAAMEADFEERHEEGETMLDINCDEIGMEKETGINGGGEMHNNPNHKLSIEPMAGNGVDLLAMQLNSQLRPMFLVRMVVMQAFAGRKWTV